MLQELTFLRNFAAPGEHLCGLTWDGKYLWHSDASTDRIYCLDPRTGGVMREIPCEQVRTDLGYDGSSLWQIAGIPKHIRVLDVRTGEVQDEIDLGPNAEMACGLMVDGAQYWIGFKDEVSGVIERRSKVNHAVLAEYFTLPHVDGLAKVGGTLWHTSFSDRLLVALDIDTKEELKRYILPGEPTGMCWDGERFWYNDYSHHRIAAVRPPLPE